MKIPIVILLAFVTAASLQGTELLTSSGAWTTTGINASSGTQANTVNNGAFSSWGGASFNSNTTTTYIDMQTAAGNPQQNYTAGYTYSYSSKGFSPTNALETTFNVQLLGNGALVGGTQVTGNNYQAAGGDELDSNVINGSYQVNGGDALIGQRIGMRINSNGEQTRFRAEDGAASLSVLLTNHLGFDGGNGEGALYSTTFNGSAQTTTFDYVLDMVLSGSGVVGSNFVRINNTDTTQQTATFASATDTFRAGTSYQITFDANRSFKEDAAQDSLNIVLGGGTYTENIVMSDTRSTYTFTVDADAEGLVGQAVSFDFLADSLTTSGTNQFRIYDFEMTAIPEANNYALLTGVLLLTSVMFRRRP